MECDQVFVFLGCILIRRDTRSLALQTWFSDVSLHHGLAQEPSFQEVSLKKATCAVDICEEWDEFGGFLQINRCKSSANALKLYRCLNAKLQEHIQTTA